MVAEFPQSCFLAEILGTAKGWRRGVQWTRDLVSAFCKWCSSVGFIELWPLACTCLQLSVKWLGWELALPSLRLKRVESPLWVGDELLPQQGLAHERGGSGAGLSWWRESCAWKQSWPNLTYSHKFWVETERIDSNEIEFLLKDVWAQPWRESAELGCSGGAQNTHYSSLKWASWGGGLCDHFGGIDFIYGLPDV